MVSDVVQDHKDESLAEGRGAAGGDDIAREVDVALGGGAFGGESSSSDHRRTAITRDVLPFQHASSCGLETAASSEFVRWRLMCGSPGEPTRGSLVRKEPLPLGFGEFLVPMRQAYCVTLPRECLIGSHDSRMGRRCNASMPIRI